MVQTSNTKFFEFGDTIQAAECEQEDPTQNGICLVIYQDIENQIAHGICLEE